MTSSSREGRRFLTCSGNFDTNFWFQPRKLQKLHAQFVSKQKTTCFSHLFNSRPFQIVVLASELDHDRHLERSCHFGCHSSPGCVAHFFQQKGSTVPRILGFWRHQEKTLTVPTNILQVNKKSTKKHIPEDLFQKKNGIHAFIPTNFESNSSAHRAWRMRSFCAARKSSYQCIFGPCLVAAACWAALWRRIWLVSKPQGRARWKTHKKKQKKYAVFFWRVDDSIETSKCDHQNG